MRDSIKSEKYFDEFIAEDTARILKLTKKVNDGEVRPERLVPVKQGIFRIKLGIIIARYSKGDNIACLRSDFMEIYEEWIMSFFSPVAYNENLKMISLAVLFEIEQKLITLTKRKLKEKAGYFLPRFLSDYILIFNDRSDTVSQIWRHIMPGTIIHSNKPCIIYAGSG